MFPVKGSVIVADGVGKVNVITPNGNDQFLMFDPDSEKGARFVDVKNYIPRQRLKINSSKKNYANGGSFDKITEVSLPGEKYSKIDSIKVISYMDHGVSSYTVKIINTKTGDLIAENTFINTSPEINTLSPLNNLPEEEAIVEVSIRKNGANVANLNKYAYLYEVSIELVG